MQASSMKPINTFTIGFNENHYDEATHAGAIAAHLGTNHTELYLTAQDALDLVPQMPSMYDEPFADSSQLPTHLVMKMARQHVAVALSGDGADELFGGYNRYTYAPKVWRHAQKLPVPLRRVLCASLTAIPASALNKLSMVSGVSQMGDKAHKLGQRLSGVNSIDDFYVSLVSEWQDVESLVVGNPVTSNVLDIRARWPKLDNAADRMMALDALSYLPDDILVKVDRAAMAVSLESRAPFLDHELVEFAWQLPMGYKIRNGQGKWLLRRLLNRYIPKVLTDRPKMGFGIPLDGWLRGPLRAWAESLLAEDRLQQEGYLNPAPIRDAWLRHQTGKANYGYRLWSVLMFQAWLQEQ
jgi:asparagine synthase (glutamine-hydrolysing)